MIHHIVAGVIGIILIILGCVPASGIQGGAKRVDKKKNDEGEKSNQLTEGEYARAMTVAPYDDRWARGDLVKDYPQCPFITDRGALPPGLEYTSAVPLTAHPPERHWGQRKLLLSEIDFLKDVPTERAIVVYAGAADGRHIPILVEMYPHIEFHLYDPLPFYPGIDGHKNIRINPFYGGSVNTDQHITTPHGWFTDEVAQWYATREGRWCNAKLDGKFSPGTCRALYFISDIRTVPTEEEVERNQRQQENWVKLMRPRRSMVKFRVPYPHVGAPRAYTHTRGRVRLQCWAPVHSAETRLIIDGMGTAKWDTVQHERQCAWYNQIMRRHDFRDRPLRDFGIPLDITVGAFWAPYVPPTLLLGFDFVYELQILAGQGSTEAALRERVELINRTLISRGAHFQNYLKK